MAIIIATRDNQHLITRLFSEWQQGLPPPGPMTYAMPPRSNLPNGQIKFERVPDHFLAVLRQAGIPFQEGG